MDPNGRGEAWNIVCIALSSSLHLENSQKMHKISRKYNFLFENNGFYLFAKRDNPA